MSEISADGLWQIKQIIFIKLNDIIIWTKTEKVFNFLLNISNNQH